MDLNSMTSGMRARGIDGFLKEQDLLPDEATRVQVGYTRKGSESSLFLYDKIEKRLSAYLFEFGHKLHGFVHHFGRAQEQRCTLV